MTHVTISMMPPKKVARAEIVWSFDLENYSIISKIFINLIQHTFHK